MAWLSEQEKSDHKSITGATIPTTAAKTTTATKTIINKSS